LDARLEPQPTEDEKVLGPPLTTPRSES
jgi:hypothetical protein